MPATGSDPLAPRNHSRLFAGMALQPVVAALLGFVIFPLVEATTWVVGHRGASVDLLDAAAAFAFGAALVAFFVTLLGVFPTVAWRLRRGPFTKPQILIAGLLLGNVPLIVLATVASLNGEMPLGPRGALVGLRALGIGALFGLTGAAVFWLVAVRGSIYDARARGELRRV